MDLLIPPRISSGHQDTDGGHRPASAPTETGTRGFHPGGHAGRRSCRTVDPVRPCGVPPLTPGTEIASAHGGGGAQCSSTRPVTQPMLIKFSGGKIYDPLN